MFTKEIISYNYFLARFHGNIGVIVTILRDISYSNHVNMSWELSIIKHNGNEIAFEYLTEDDYGKKIILIPLLETLVLERYIETQRSKNIPVMLLTKINKNSGYMEGGIYKTNRSIDFEFEDFEIDKIESFKSCCGYLRKEMLPTSNLEKYMDWIDNRCTCFGLKKFDVKNYCAIVAVLNEPVKIVAFYWDMDDSNENAILLIQKIYRDYIIFKDIFVTTIKSNEQALIKCGFERIIEWRMV